MTGPCLCNLSDFTMLFYVSQPLCFLRQRLKIRFNAWFVAANCTFRDTWIICIHVAGVC